ncbi:hypothetical protein N752_06175 [Desulforamulus aquiferis]|nr:hypothetical protein [Desulforamulus aquiferis]RYD06113.1 hypothetical protein N752_06175 [Desulforamulus aquiferis]
MGLGAATAMATGAMAAYAIIKNRDYNKLVQKYKRIINIMSNYRNFYDTIDDDTFDTIVRSEDNPVLSKLVYGTNIDWLKYGSIAFAPFLKHKDSPNFHETYSSPK